MAVKKLKNISITSRLFSQHIQGKKFKTPEDAVRWMGAMQAQDYHQSLWAIGARLQTPTLAGVEKAIAAGKILRTWPIRGTIHFVAPEDAKWMVTLAASRMIAKDGSRMKTLELTHGIIMRCGEIFAKALQGGKRFSRADMMALLEAKGISTANQRSYHILWYLSQIGLLCIGPRENKQQTFALLDEWAPQSKALPKEEALAELALRYFTGHGPSTVLDLAWWAGASVAEAKQGLEGAKAGLVSEKIGGVEHWFAEGAVNTKGYDALEVNLLAGYDEYLLGYKTRSAVLAEEHAMKVAPGRNGVFNPIIVIGDQVVGTWKRTIKKTAVEIAFSPFAKMDIPQESLDTAAERYKAFMEVRS